MECGRRNSFLSNRRKLVAAIAVRIDFFSAKEKGETLSRAGKRHQATLLFPKIHNRASWIVIINTKRGLLLPEDPHGPIRYFIYAQGLHRACHRP